MNYHLIAKAISFYENQCGYRSIEVPWIVSKGAIDATLPPGARAFSTEVGYLVGSAEQSYIELMLQGELPKGRYVTASPCFRDEPVLDNLHQRGFFKVELIDTYDSANPYEVVEDALAFFRSIPGAGESCSVATPSGWDIELHGIEIGSYGMRTFKDFWWVYGTGVAEPRLSRAILEGARRRIRKVLDGKRK